MSIITQRMVVTQGVLEKLPLVKDANWVAECISGMEEMNWGDAMQYEEDVAQNNEAFNSNLETGRIVASFTTKRNNEEIKLFIITEKGEDEKPLTTIMLQGEY